MQTCNSLTKASSLVILGAGHAGFQLALFARQSGFAGAIRLINDEPYPPYQRPPLSKTYLKSAGGPESLFFRPPKFFADQSIEIVAAKAVEIDRRAGRVGLSSGAAISYDHLVIATGARNRALSVPGAGPDVLYIRSLAEAEELKRRMPFVRRVVVIGAGFIGLEFAATARALGASVDVIEMAPRAMARAVTPQISAFFKARHEAAGVCFHFGKTIREIVRKDDAGKGVLLESGTRIEADLVVAGIGVTPNIELAAAAGLETATGVLVNELLLTNDPAISAIGDCAEFPSRHAGTHTRIESVQNATDQARSVALRLTGKPHAFTDLPWFWSDQGPDKLQIAGLATGADQTIVRGDEASGSFSVFSYRAAQLIAIESVNRAADHVLGRKVLGSGRNIPIEAAVDAKVELKRFAR